MSAEDYPIVPNIEEGTPVTVLAHIFKEALEKTNPSVAKNDIRPELAGVYLGFNTDKYDGLVLASTDSFRLAEKKMSLMQGSDEVKAILPLKGSQEIVRLLGQIKKENKESQLRIWVSSHQFGMRYEGFELSIRLIDGNYPDYTQIIPTEFQTTLVLDKENFLKKIKAASLFSGAGINSINFECSAESGQLNLLSQNAQSGEHKGQIDAEITGGDNKIVLNFRYLLDGLAQIPGNDVEFLLNGPDAPCMLRGKGAFDYFYLVMPIRQ